jgi:hypothetical protein
MRLIPITLAIVVAAAALPTPAKAEITKLDKLALGQKWKKAKPKQITLYGCQGSLFAAPGKDKKVSKVTFESASKCSLSAMATAITNEFGSPAKTNANGDSLWEGTTASIILTQASYQPGVPIMYLVPPVAGKRVCWGDDGFDAFWASFKKAVATGKGAAIAASFKLPFTDEDGNFEIKDAKAFETRWTELIGKDDAKELASGTMKPTCSIPDEQYTISLGEPNGELKASRKGDAWQWSTIALTSTD